jgi:hypothetical protein
MLTGTCAQAALGGRLAAREQQPARPARADGEHDVVDRAPEMLLDRLQLVELEAHGGKVARRARWFVEARVRLARAVEMWRA